MTTTLKKIRRGKKWLTGVLYCFCLVIVIGLGGVSPAWAMRECPATGSEWNELAMEINAAYKDMQEDILGIDWGSAKPGGGQVIKQFDRKATRWMGCLTEFMRQPDGALSPDRTLDAALIRTQVDLIDGLVRYAKSCARDPVLSCDGFAKIQVVFSATATESPEGPGLILTSAFRGNPFGNTWDNFLSVVGM